MSFWENLAADFFLETRFGEGFFFKTNIFEQNTPETAIFEENSEEQVLRLDGSVPSIVSNFTSLFQAMTGVEGQFLAKSSFEHTGFQVGNLCFILWFFSMYCQSCFSVYIDAVFF